VLDPVSSCDPVPANSPVDLCDNDDREEEEEEEEDEVEFDHFGESDDE